jgi:hypothetical protein
MEKIQPSLYKLYNKMDFKKRIELSYKNREKKLETLGLLLVLIGMIHTVNVSTELMNKIEYFLNITYSIIMTVVGFGMIILYGNGRLK